MNTDTSCSKAARLGWVAAFALKAANTRCWIAAILLVTWQLSRERSRTGNKMAAEEDLGVLCNALDTVLTEFFAALQELEDLRRSYDTVARDVRILEWF